MRRLALVLLLLLVPVWAQPPSPSASPGPQEHHDEHDSHGHDEHGDDEHGHDEHGHDEHGHDEHGDEDHEWSGHGQEHQHNAVVEAGGEYTNAKLHAKSDDYPAMYKFMIRESNSEPYRLKGQSNLVFRDAALVWGLNIVLIVYFYRRRR